MVKFVLFIVRLFKKPIEWWGISFHHLETILKTKLELDMRRPLSSGQATGKKSRTIMTQILVFGLIGIFTGLIFLNIDNLLLSTTFFFAFLFVMLISSLISEYTSVLFDSRDNDILLVRPLCSRTLLLSRIIHIQYYTGIIAFSLSLFSIIFLAFKYGILCGLLFLIAVGMCNWISILITIFFYMILSRFVSNEKFKDIITYVQIFIAIAIFGGYQLVPRLVDIDAINQMSMSIEWYSYLIPPIWLAAIVKLGYAGIFDPQIYLLAAMGLAGTITGAVIVIRFLSKGYGHILSEESVEDSAPVEKKTFNEKIRHFFSGIICKTRMEKSGWDLAMRFTKRDRKFKAAVYPSFGFVLIFAVVMLKPDLNNMQETLDKLSDSSRYLFFVFLGYFGTTGIHQLPFTDKPEASWIYKALPVKQHGHILSGALKAIFFKLFLPIYIIVTIPAIYIWGISVLPKMFIGALLIIMITLLLVYVSNKSIPFTQARQMQQKGTNVLKMFLGIFAMGLAVGLVYLSSLLDNVYIVFCSGLVIIANMLIFSSIRKRKYEIMI